MRQREATGKPCNSRGTKKHEKGLLGLDFSKKVVISVYSRGASQVSNL